MSENSLDVALLGRIAAVERKLLATCDLISLGSWGFDESVQEKLRQQRNKVVNQHLSKKERKSFSNAQKGRFARTIGVANTVSEVLDWMSTSSLKDVQPKAANLTQKPVEKKEKPTPVPKKEQVAKPATKEESSDESDSEDEEVATPTPAVKKPAPKPIATVKPTPRAEPEKVMEESDDEDEKMEEDDEDSTDDEVEEIKEKGGKKRKAEPSVAAAPAKKTKVDRELEKYENVDPTTLDPIESRKVAMLKLQKKIETFKQTRVSKKKQGGKSATDAESERKMKRRMSKLALKQRRAEEKKQQLNKDGGEKAAAPAAVKEEDLPRNEDGKVVYSKFDFIVKDPKKKRLSTKEKKDKFTGKDYKSLLNKVEKRNEKLEKLKESDPEKAKAMEEEIKWNRALKKAEGVKVKDNVELLKKGLKNKEKAKEKRLSKWQQREEKVSADKAKRQEKRSTNLHKRIDDKKKRTMQKLRAKGRIL